MSGIASVMSDSMIGGIPARVAEIQARFAPAKTTTAASSTSTEFASALTAASSTSETGASSASTVTGDDAVAQAKKYLGLPYVFGSTDPSKGLDCSSLTQLAYKNLGIDIPRTSWDQGKAGTEVKSLADAKPGDLIVYDNGAHVTMYIGNGQLIHAPSTGSFVRVQNVWQPITSIRRIIPERTSAVTGSGSALSTQSILGASASSGGPDQVGASIPYASLFNEAGAKYGVSPRLLAAMAKTESNFNPKAGSGAGAQGLMQFMPGTARSYGIDPWDPAQAIDGAARYMKGGLAQFGQTELAVAAYNAGPGAVQNAGNRVPAINETQNYVRLVMQRMGEMG